MKKISLILINLVLQTCLIAQRHNDGDAPTLYNGIGTFYEASRELRLFNAAMLNSQGFQISAKKRLDGSMFLNPEWQFGYMRLSNNAVIDSIPMKWNALSQEVFIMDGEKEYFINNHFHEFGYTETVNEKQIKHLFRTGFPPVKKNTEKTVYEVLGGVDLQLLKFIEKQLQENRSLDGQTYYRIAEEISYFVYDSANKTMTPVRKGAQELKQDFPQVESQIEEFSRNNKQKCRTEQGLVELFSGIKLNTVANPKKAF